MWCQKTVIKREFGAISFAFGGKTKRVQKEGPAPFFPTLFFPSLTVIPFVSFSYGKCQCFWVEVALNVGLITIQDGNLKPLYKMQSYNVFVW
jgi:hypothetical protein